MDEVHAWHEQDFIDHVFTGSIGDPFQTVDSSPDQKIGCMKKGMFFFIFVAAFTLPQLCKGQRCDSILWSEHHSLKWRYFKGKPDLKNNMAALSESHIFYEISTANTLAKLFVTCSFLTCKSWVKTTTSHLLLQHEQTHFDIAEYHRRLMVKEVMSQTFSNKDIISRVQAIGLKINQQRFAMDELYDIDTYHSVNEDKQHEWSKKVKKLLRELSAFEKDSYLISLH